MSDIGKSYHRPRDGIQRHEYTPLSPKRLNSREFIPSVKVVKRVRPGDSKARDFTLGVSKVVKNQRKCRDRVRGHFSTPHHSRLSTELISQKKLAEQSLARGYTPQIHKMRSLALALRAVLEEYYRDNPEHQLVKLGEITTDRNGNKDKLVILPDQAQLEEQEISGLAIVEELPPQLGLDPSSIYGDCGIVIGSSDGKIRSKDLTIIKRDIQPCTPEGLAMMTVVELHSGLGRTGVESFEVAA